MAAIADNYSFSDVAVQSIEAGCDIILICKDQGKQQEAIHALYDAVEAGKITEERIAKSYKRIEVCKETYLASWQPLSSAYARYIIGCEAHKRRLEQIFG